MGCVQVHRGLHPLRSRKRHDECDGPDHRPEGSAHPGVELDDRQQHRQHDQHHHARPSPRSAAARGWWPAPSRGAALRRRAGSAARSSIVGSWPVCSPRRANIASRPGKRFLPASAEASGAPSRTCTSASIASARMRAVATAFRRRPAAPSGSARRRRPASPACRRSAPRCSRARAGRPAAASARRRRSARGRPRCAASSISIAPPADDGQRDQPAPVAHEGADRRASRR